MRVKRNGFIILAAIAALYAVMVVIVFLTGYRNTSSLLSRLFAMLGITSMFIASIMSAFLKQVYKAFGTPFIKMHHVFAIAGLVLITLHPVYMAINWANPLIFLPDFSSWYDFWRLAGRPALILIYVALAGVLLKKILKKSWRILHALNYIALFFGVVHAFLLANMDYQNPAILVIYAVMMGVTIAALVYKRVQKARKQKSKKNVETPQGSGAKDSA